MDVLVPGGTGFIGRHLCRTLLERGHAVTACSRDPDAGDVPAGVILKKADITNYQSIQGLIAEHEAVVNLVALSPMLKPRDGDAMHERVHLTGTRNIVRGMIDSDCERLVQISAMHANPDGPTAYLRAKGKAEGVVQSSDIRWSIIRPTVVFGPGDEFIEITRKLTTPYVTALPGGGKARFQPIAVEDLCTVLATGLSDVTHTDGVYEIGGPAVYSLAGITRAIYAAQDKPVRIVPIPMLLTRLGLTIMDPIPRLPFGTDQYRALFVDAVPDSNDVSAFGLTTEDLRTLEADLTDRFSDNPMRNAP